MTERWVSQKMVCMDRFEGRCWLDWWANSSTLLGSADIAVVIAATPAGWDARGHLVSNDDDEREGFAFLCDLDPVFMLRFEDGSTVPATVHSLDEEGRFVLTEYTGPAQRSIDQRVKLQLLGDSHRSFSARQHPMHVSIDEVDR